MSNSTVSASATGLLDRRLFLAAVDNVVSVRIVGDDNSPTIVNGDVAFLDTNHTEISPPGLYGMRDPYGKIIIHRMDTFVIDGRAVVRIWSDNPRSGRRLAPLADVDVAGRVCGVMKVL